MTAEIAEPAHARSLADRTARTAELVAELHAIVEELEKWHPGRKFPLDGHLVGSLGEAACEAMFDIVLQPASTPGHDAVAGDGRTVEIKATYGDRSVGIRATSHDHAQALIVLRLSRRVDVDHEVVYNGPFKTAVAVAGPLQKNGQAPISLTRLRAANVQVDDADRVTLRKP
ncbi:hypothetical protein [Mycobacterium sp. OTB74]|uniref:DUF6998 domain-containing protein n=1 Tax=Mycobacterium sp. OTB74 TaxID=1853452 RepID=UPI0024748E72|nr:hypothetical protein [Mycobacterium sp. OTB74]MDH6245490.1 hypothetical protein [Mycobacterium sp. OTB74]